MKARIIIALVGLATLVASYYMQAHTKPSEPAELLTPQEYAEYIDAQDKYIQFLEDELSRIDDAYIGDVLVETDQYWDYQEATNKYLHIPTFN